MPSEMTSILHDYKLSPSEMADLEADFDENLNYKDSNETRNTTVPIDDIQYGDTLDLSGYSNCYDENTQDLTFMSRNSSYSQYDGTDHRPYNSYGIARTPLTRITWNNNQNRSTIYDENTKPRHVNIITPPSSGSRYKPAKVSQATQSALEELRDTYENRISLIKETEEKRLNALESTYRKQIDTVRRELDHIMRKHDQVIRIKDQMLSELEIELDRAKQDYEEANRMAISCREHNHDKLLRDTNEKVRSLTDQLEKYKQKLEYTERQLRTGMFSYEHSSDMDVAKIIQASEQEKNAALSIAKAKFKSELNILIPQIKKHCEGVFKSALDRERSSLKQRYQDHCNRELRKCKEDMQLEKEIAIRTCKEQFERDKQRWLEKIRADCELRIIEAKTSAEKEVLQRIKRQRNGQNYSSSQSSPRVSRTQQEVQDEFLSLLPVDYVGMEVHREVDNFESIINRFLTHITTATEDLEEASMKEEIQKMDEVYKRMLMWKVRAPQLSTETQRFRSQLHMTSPEERDNLLTRTKAEINRIHLSMPNVDNMGEYLDFKRKIHAVNHDDVPQTQAQTRTKPRSRSHDDDIELTAEVESNICPLSKLPLTNPMKAPCGHIFSKSAIESYFTSSGLRQVLNCPAQGCSKNYALTAMERHTTSSSAPTRERVFPKK